MIPLTIIPVTSNSVHYNLSRCIYIYTHIVANICVYIYIIAYIHNSIYICNSIHITKSHMEQDPITALRGPVAMLGMSAVTWNLNTKKLKMRAKNQQTYISISIHIIPIPTHTHTHIHIIGMYTNRFNLLT